MSVLSIYKVLKLLDLHYETWERVVKNYWLHLHTVKITAYHWLNMELDLQTPYAQLYALAETPNLPRIWAHIRGSYWSAKIDDISL